MASNAIPRIHMGHSCCSCVFFGDIRMWKLIQTSVMILPMHLYKAKNTMPQGKEKILEENDIPQLRQADRAQTCYLVFKEQLSKQKQKATYEPPSMFSVIISCQKKEIVLSGFFALIKVLTVSTSPLFLKAFIEVAEGNATFEYEGYALAGGLFLAKCLESFSERQWFFQTRLIGLQVRSFLSAAIYQKQLQLSSAAKVTHSPGQIVNHVTVDAYKIATVGALIVIILTMVASSPLAKLQLKYQTKLMEPIRMIPDVVGVFIEAKVSLTRIVKFLEAPELENRNTRNINLVVKQGEKVAICGEVGTGKSTLLAAILGEVPNIKGIVNVYGKIAYVSQTSWIQTGSIQENILFGSPMDPLRYQEVLRRCSLIEDLEMLPFGDLTEIGERGVTLSGGQKQRVQLARALYQDSDVYLLDDPFSAVDANTATSLFNEYVMGALSRKTVLLVTHQVDFLPAFDSVLFMTEGKILRASTYVQLLASSQEFQNLVNAHRDSFGSETQAKYASSGKSKPSKSEIHRNYNEKQLVSSLGDQLIKQEERETGNTGLKPYIQYLNQNKGFLYFSLATVSSDLTVIDLDLAFRLSSSLGTVIVSYSGYAILAILTWPILFIIIPMVYLTILLQRYYFASAKELMQTDGTTKSFIASHLAESIAGAMTIRAFREEERFFLKNLNLIDRNVSPYFHNFSANQWLIQRLEILCAIVLSSSALPMTLLRLGASSFDPAQKGTNEKGRSPVWGLITLRCVQSWCLLENLITSVERIEQYMHIPGEAAEVIESQRPMHNWPVVGKVKICDLKGISCIFEGGHKIGIVGRTGSGKTTLISALFHLVEPTEGMIIIDGIDISSVGLHDLRSRLGIIPQDPTLFSGCVRYNLDPLSEHTDQEIWEVLRKCQLREAICEKEEGLNSLVMQDGSNWSLGQRQLFCLGRALLKRSQILVLDEATASIDNATDSLIQKTIRTEFTGCTVITVAHRMPTVMDCTKVLTISDGKIVEYDEPLQLMNKEGSLFGQLVKEYWSHSASGNIHSENC
uniref:ABC-type xenobiotic transporter n=1 Tax=Fagus sylvatica TaxID=28930 RepID=A0A2N9FIA9_FAGSY